MNIDFCLKHGLSLDACYTALLIETRSLSIFERLPVLCQLSDLGHEEAAWLVGVLKKHADMDKIHLADYTIKSEWFLNEKNGRAYFFAFWALDLDHDTRMGYLQTSAELGYDKGMSHWAFFNQDDYGDQFLQKAFDVDCSGAYESLLLKTDIPSQFYTGTDNSIHSFHLYKAAMGGHVNRMLLLSLKTCKSNPEFSIYWLVAFALCGYYQFHFRFGEQMLLKAYSEKYHYLLGKYTWLFNLRSAQCFRFNKSMILKQVEDIFLERKTKAQSQVFSWLLCAKRIGLLRDVALLIARQIWATRLE